MIEIQPPENKQIAGWHQQTVAEVVAQAIAEFLISARTTATTRRARIMATSSLRPANCPPTALSESMARERFAGRSLSFWIAATAAFDSRPAPKSPLRATRCFAYSHIEPHERHFDNRRCRSDGCGLSANVRGSFRPAPPDSRSRPQRAAGDSSHRRQTGQKGGSGGCSAYRLGQARGAFH
jgi:hypothetical protein